MSADPLAGLRGLHLPAALQPEFSHLALAAGLGVAAAVLLRLAVAAFRRRRSTLAELDAASAQPPPERLVAQAALLRRLVRRRHGATAAAEHGEAWLARLDTMTRTDFFRRGPGRVFGPALYGRSPPPEGLDAGLRAALRRL